MADCPSPARFPQDGMGFLFNPTTETVFRCLIHAKQFLKRANNDQLNVYISNAIQRIDVPYRAERAEALLDVSNSFIDSKLADIDEKERKEMFNRMAAVSLIPVRQAVKKGVVGELGIDWDVVKSMFDEKLHREILDDEQENCPPELLA